MKLGFPPRRKAGEEAPRVGAHDPGSYATATGRPRGGGIPPERLWFRAAAFGVDILLLAGVPLLLATLIVFAVLFASSDPPPRIGLVFRAAQALFVAAFLVRDAGGASPGKRVFGLRTTIAAGKSTLLASVTRNLPLLVPGWNLLEALLVLRGDQRRPGDRLAGTAVLEA
jgi:uncharacterized RDD family membrane protein YckC